MLREASPRGDAVGVARIIAMILGIAHPAVALVEVVLGSDGLVVGDGASTNSVILLVEPVHNAVHWFTGLVLLGSSLAGEAAARAAAKVVGVAFLALTVLGLMVGELTMGLLGYEGAPAVPISYSIVNAVTAAGGLYAGFARQGRRAGLPLR
jgi:Domain of unknown function (DUF4383)